MVKSPAQLKADIDDALRAQQSSGPEYVGFSSWGEVLDAARQGTRLWYKAPMDHRPRSIAVVKVFNNGGIRIDPLSNQNDKFTATAGHLDRFYRRA